MNEVHFNSSKAILSASQYRIRMERRLRSILGEESIVGPLDPFIGRAVERGLVDPGLGESLAAISRYCESVSMSTDRRDFPSFDELRSWSDVIERLRRRRQRLIAHTAQ